MMQCHLKVWHCMPGSQTEEMSTSDLTQKLFKTLPWRYWGGDIAEFSLWFVFMTPLKWPKCNRVIVISALMMLLSLVSVTFLATKKTCRAQSDMTTLFGCSSGFQLDTSSAVFLPDYTHTCFWFTHTRCISDDHLQVGLLILPEKRPQ